MVEQAADDRGSGGKLAGQLGEAGLLLAARHEVAVKVGEPLGTSMIMQAALLLVDDREAATDTEPAERLWWWGLYTRLACRG